ncbi:DUF2158 domain-containing protein [Aeromonas veronii]
MSFNRKDRVRLKGSNGPCMWVEVPSSDGSITCSWFDETEGVKEDVFAFDTLEYCDSADQVASNAQKIFDLNKR